MSQRSERRSVTVRIAGEEHTIRSNAEPEYTVACARYVDDRIREVREKSGLVEGHKAAILAALSVTDQYFQMRDELEALRKELHDRSADLVKRIDKAIPKEGPGA